MTQPWHEIDSRSTQFLGQHDLTQVCPKAITLSYNQDVSGARSSDKGLLLIPAPALGGAVPAFGGTKPNDPCEKSATSRDGVLAVLGPELHHELVLNSPRSQSGNCQLRYRLQRLDN